jgi:mRNA interferase MazF
MKIGAMFNQGDIVLIPIPFTDLSSNKRRPVIVISRNDYNRTTADMVVVAMTSNPAIFRRSFTINNADLVLGKLNLGQVRVDKIYTLSQLLIARIFGRVNQHTVQDLREHGNGLPR